MFAIVMEWKILLEVASIISAVLAAVVLLYLWTSYVDVPSIRGLPEIPGGELLAGHLYQLGRDHASTGAEWAKRYGWPVF